MEFIQNSILKGKEVCQVGIVVPDIEKAVKKYADLFGVTAPTVELTDPYDTAHTVYKGKPTQAQANLAFFDIGMPIIELIEPVGGPSTWKDFLDIKGQGMHHVAFLIENMEEQCKRFADGFKMETVQTGDYEGGCYAYIDATAQLGLYIELLENFSD
jgi:catechol 2,3-dioxygenase-like lactoylglutathione lyase family enzyme